MVLNMSLPSIATWRWRTLVQACKAFDTVLRPLCLHFRASSFQNSRDPVRVEKVGAAMANPAFTIESRFVHWFGSWITKTMGWGGGCACHSTTDGDDLAAGEQCPWKGRRLKEAWHFSQSSLREALDEANSWAPSSLGGDMAFWSEVQGCVRATVALAQEKIQFLDKVPYLLVRLGEEGIKRKALYQFGACSISSARSRVMG